MCLVHSNGEMLAAAMLADHMNLCSTSGVNAQKIKDLVSEQNPENLPRPMGCRC